MTPQPLRGAVVGAVVLAAAGLVYGLAEAVHDYPPSSYASVTFYVAMLAAILGFVVGLAVATLRLVLRRIASAVTPRRPASNR